MTESAIQTLKTIGDRALSVGIGIGGWETLRHLGPWLREQVMAMVYNAVCLGGW